MKSRVVATLIALLCLNPGTVTAASIQVLWGDCEVCCGYPRPPFRPIYCRIVATLCDDPASNGISGAEFQVRNWPAGWFASVSANPAAILAVGNPLSGGCNIAFSACQTGGGEVLLFTVNGYATTSGDGPCLTIDRHNTPSNPQFMCPLLLLCDAPVYTAVCVDQGSCTVSTAPTSWSALKETYR